MSSDNNSISITWPVVRTASAYNIYISTNFSQGFQDINATVTDLNFTDANVFDSSRRYYKVAAVKGANYALSNFSAGKHTVLLQPSWNLISVPFNLSSWTLYNGTDGINPFTDPGACIISLWRFNVTNQSFERTDLVSGEWRPPPLGPSSFTSLEPGRGYWAEVASDCNITLFGTVPANNLTINLSLYWDIVSLYSARDPLLGDETLMKIVDVDPPGSVSTILRYNPQISDFEVTVYYPGYGWFPSFNNQDFNYMDPFVGYYFDVAQPANWTMDPGKG